MLIKPLKINVVKSDMKVNNVSGKTLATVGKTELNILIDNVVFKQEFLIVNNICQDMILGCDFLYDNAISIDFSKSRLSCKRFDLDFYPRKKIVRINENVEFVQSDTEVLKKNEYAFFHDLVVKNENNMYEGCMVVESKPEFNISHSVSVEQNDLLTTLLHKYRSRFAFNKNELGKCGLVKVAIKTSDDIPTHRAPYRVSGEQHKVIRDQIEEMLENGIIRESKSPYASPVVLVKKPDGSWRFCVDYRKLNKKVITDSYPLPIIEDLISHLNGAKYFADLDCNSGYWQLEIEEKEKHKTAFITPSGLYEFNVLPFGLKTSGAIFQRTMDKALAGIKYKNAIVYVDNIIVYGKTFEEFHDAMDQVLKRLEEANLTLKPSKCSFAYEEISVLGHKISGRGILPDEEKIKKLKSIKVPSNTRELKSVLGLFSYYRKFIDCFANTTVPLNKLLRKNVKFEWSEIQQRSFDKILSMILNPPLLKHFDNSENVITRLNIDASDVALGACILQEEGKNMMPVSFASRKLSAAEKKYSITEKECLALVWALNYFRPYLHGLKFQVVTDHKALCWLRERRDMNGRLARWALAIQEHDFEIVHCSGKQNVIADFLSRNPLKEDDEEETTVAPRTQVEDGLHLYSIEATQVTMAQQTDEFCQRQERELRQRRRPIYKGFFIRDNVLYKKYTVHGVNKNLLVVPSVLFNEVMDDIHDNPFIGGHLGLTKTLDKFRSRYFMYKATERIEKYIKSCVQCQEKKKRNIVVPLRPIIVDRLFQAIEIDIIGPLNKSSRGKQYIITCIESMSKYAVCKPVRRATARTVSNFLIQEVFCRFGVVQTIISDRGSIFTSEIVRETIRRFDSRHVTATTMHPQTVGLIERFNQTLLQMLSKYSDPLQRNWCMHVPMVTHAYNCSKQASTKFSPYFVMFLKEPESVSDRSLNINFPDLSLRQRQRIRHSCVNKVNENLRKARLVQKVQYDKKARPVRFAVGQLVLLFCPKRIAGISKKLSRPYKGPYRIKRVREHDNYIISKPHTSRKIKVHANRLKPFRLRL